MDLLRKIVGCTMRFGPPNLRCVLGRLSGEGRQIYEFCADRVVGATTTAGATTTGVSECVRRPKQSGGAMPWGWRRFLCVVRELQPPTEKERRREDSVWRGARIAILNWSIELARSIRTRRGRGRIRLASFFEGAHAMQDQDGTPAPAPATSGGAPATRGATNRSYAFNPEGRPYLADTVSPSAKKRPPRRPKRSPWWTAPGEKCESLALAAVDRRRLPRLD